MRNYLPMTMSPLTGIGTVHGSPPNLQAIWMAILVATLWIPFGTHFLRTVAVTT